MLRKFSTFRKDRKKSVNGIKGVNGIVKGENGKSKQSTPEPIDTHVEPETVNSTFAEYAQVLHVSKKPLPDQSEDGTYTNKEETTGLLSDLKNLGFKDLKTLKEVIGSKAAGELVDDKTYIMERVIQLVSGLPQTSKTRVDLTNAFVDELWNALQHPPLSYLGDRFVYRQADGSYNNITMPHLGAANMPYARSVIPKTVQPGALPDPGLIFDAVFARNKFTEHPNKVSSILFYWASLIIHDLFQTDHRDISNSQTSSYLDLSPLYGDVQEDQDQIRTFKDGKLKADCFAEHRMLGFPPGCGVLLIMFNRFHNYVVEQLALINENGRFTKPNLNLTGEAAEKAWAKYDNDLFQTGRLITCGLYMNITLLDYLRTIVNLNRSNTTWTLDPRVDMEGNKSLSNPNTPRGVGNQVSAEFNLVYRWHSATSKRDEEWTENMYKQMFGKSANEVSMLELMQGLGKWAAGLDPDPQKRPFAGLQRGVDGNYNDDDLVNILADSIEDCAGSFGANNVPKALRAVEILGMQQSRKWGLCTLNEFRKFFGLAPHETFESIHSDPVVANNLRNLYEHPDFVELYPGLVAEEAKVPMVPGVGIAPTFTISRAILSDAVVLVRGDRFYTIDYHAKNLTNWGYREAQYDLNIEQGCVFYKLFLRAFPNHFKTNSIYAHYPMTVPSENRKIMQSLGRKAHYDYSRPRYIPPRVTLNSHLSAKSIVDNQAAFKTLWGATEEELFARSGVKFVLSGDGELHSKQRQILAKSLYVDGWEKAVKEYYEYITIKLLHEKSFTIAGIKHVDITRDIGNLAPVHFASNVFSLPLKTKDWTSGVFSEHEMYIGIAAMFASVFLDIDPVKSFPLNLAAEAIAKTLVKEMQSTVKAVNSTGRLSGYFDAAMDAIKKGDRLYLKDYGIHMIQRLFQNGLSTEETWSQIMPLAVAMVPNQALVFTQVLDFYLQPQNAEHLTNLHRLSHLNTPEADNQITHYLLEGIRLAGTYGTYRQYTSTTPSNLPSDDHGTTVHPGTRVFVSFSGLNRDPERFPDPEKVVLNRPLESYIGHGMGPHGELVVDASRVALATMLKTVCKLSNLRRAPGPKGVLKKVQGPGGVNWYFREDGGSFSVVPLNMQVNWDGEVPPMPRAPVKENGKVNGVKVNGK